jgi:hypothetical protein
MRISSKKLRVSMFGGYLSPSFNVKFIGIRRDGREDMGVLVGRSPTNTPFFLHHPGDSHRARVCVFFSRNRLFDIGFDRNEPPVLSDFPPLLA